MDNVKEIIKNIEDDVIKRASFLLFTLIKNDSITSAIEKTKDYLKDNGWILKTNDKEFLENITHKSFRDISKWVDFNLKKA